MAAQKAQLTYGSNITWTGGALFDGYVLLIMALPSASGSAWSKVSLADTRPRLRVPTRVMVPIRQGVYDADTRVWRTDSITPPNVRYSSFFYDSTDRLVAVGSELFTVTSDTHTLTPPTLTDPTAAALSPTPETVPSAPVTVFMGPTRETPSGTLNGSNVTFTLSRTPDSLVLVVWNGMVLDEGVGYTRSGATLTMTTAPDSGDTLEALLW